MQKYLFPVLYILGGVGVGSLVTGLVVSKRVTTKYEKILSDEIDDVKRFYAQRNAQEKEKTSILLKNLNREVNSESKPVPPMEDLIKPYKSEDEDVELVVNNVFNNVFYEDGESVDPPRPDDGEDGPYVISFEEFDEERDEFTKLSLVYYEKDDVLCDEYQEVITDSEYVIGTHALDYFGWKSRDKATVYVRNESLEQDMEIIKNSGSWAQAVHGVDIDDPRPPIMKMQKDLE